MTHKNLLAIFAFLVSLALSRPAWAESYYRGGSSLDVRTNDVDIKNGKVMPTRGISLSTDKEKMKSFGGAYRVVSYPPTLLIKQRGRPDHYELVPVQAMTLDEYKAELANVKLEREDW